MAFAPNFDKTMKKVLKEKAPEYEWETGWSPVGQRWKVDLAGVPKNSKRRLVLVEVELKRDDPLGNVVKIWEWAHRKKRAQPILLVQAFSKHYWQTKERQRVRAVFIGRRMREDRNLHIRYKCEPMKYRPKMLRGFHAKHGAGRMKLAAELLANEITKLVHSD
jgi:hypothetical protein